MSSRQHNIEKAAISALLAYGQLMGMSVCCLTQGPDKGKIGYFRESDGQVFMLKERGAREGRAVHAMSVVKSVIERYYMRGEITEAQYQTGEELRNLFDKGGFLRHASLRYDGVRGSGSRFEFTGAQLDAMVSVARLLESMSRVSREFLRRCACYNEWASKVAEDHRLPSRYGIVRLREALDDLRDYWERSRRRERRRDHTMPAVPYQSTPSLDSPRDAKPAMVPASYAEESALV